MTITLSLDLTAFLTKVAPDLVGSVTAYISAAPPDKAVELIIRTTKWLDEKRSALSRKECETEGGWKQTSQQSKEDSGALLSFRDGKKVLISADSFHRHLIDRFLLSHPLDGPAKRGRATSTIFKKQENPSAIPG
jgi:hypothetical protein